MQSSNLLLSSICISPGELKRGNMIGVYCNLKYRTDKQSELYRDVDKAASY